MLYQGKTLKQYKAIRILKNQKHSYLCLNQIHMKQLCKITDITSTEDYSHMTVTKHKRRDQEKVGFPFLIPGSASEQVLKSDSSKIQMDETLNRSQYSSLQIRKRRATQDTRLPHSHTACQVRVRTRTSVLLTFFGESICWNMNPTPTFTFLSNIACSPTTYLLNANWSEQQ